MAYIRNLIIQSIHAEPNSTAQYAIVKKLLEEMELCDLTLADVSPCLEQEYFMGLLSTYYKNTFE